MKKLLKISLSFIILCSSFLVGDSYIKDDVQADSTKAIVLQMGRLKLGTDNRYRYSDAKVLSNNPDTLITSITVSFNKAGSILSGLNLPVSHTEMGTLNSADTTTKIFVFSYNYTGRGSGIDVDTATEFLSKIKLSFANLGNSNPVINIIVDTAPIFLPSGANIVEYHPNDSTIPHYYMYVGSRDSFYSSYDKAGEYLYRGMHGYLATVTSDGENDALTLISQQEGWVSGTRLTNGYFKYVECTNPNHKHHKPAYIYKTNGIGFTTPRSLPVIRPSNPYSSSEIERLARLTSTNSSVDKWQSGPEKL